MRIAHIARLAKSVPPALYGGTERIVSYLTEELVALGHDVTLFVSGESITASELVPVSPCALRLRPEPYDATAAQAIQMELVLPRAHEFDVVHFHIHRAHLSLSRFSRLGVSFLMTLHGRLDSPEERRLIHKGSAAAITSIMDAQRNPVVRSEWVGNAPYGLIYNLLQSQLVLGKYLALLGRMCREKRPDAVIRLAQRLGQPIRLAAKVDKCDEEHSDTIIRPLPAVGWSRTSFKYTKSFSSRPPPKPHRAGGPDCDREHVALPDCMYNPSVAITWR